MNRVKIVIYGKEYTIQTEESSAYVYSLAKSLEKRMDEFSSQGGASPYNAAIMTALSLLDEQSKKESSMDTLRDQVKEYVDKSGKLEMERDSALKENEVLKNKIEQLEASLSLKKLKESI